MCLPAFMFFSATKKFVPPRDRARALLLLYVAKHAFACVYVFLCDRERTCVSHRVLLRMRHLLSMHQLSHMLATVTTRGNSSLSITTNHQFIQQQRGIIVSNLQRRPAIIYDCLSCNS
jgi:hypothetical protein